MDFERFGKGSGGVLEMVLHTILIFFFNRENKPRFSSVLGKRVSAGICVFFLRDRLRSTSIKLNANTLLREFGLPSKRKLIWDRSTLQIPSLQESSCTAKCGDIKSMILRLGLEAAHVLG